jgi:hypothetical protein
VVIDIVYYNGATNAKVEQVPAANQKKASSVPPSHRGTGNGKPVCSSIIYTVGHQPENSSSDVRHENCTLRRVHGASLFASTSRANNRSPLLVCSQMSTTTASWHHSMKAQSYTAYAVLYSRYRRSSKCLRALAIGPIDSGQPARGRRLCLPLSRIGVSSLPWRLRHLPRNDCIWVGIQQSWALGRLEEGWL